jgi:hypothetical protein
MLPIRRLVRQPAAAALFLAGLLLIPSTALANEFPAGREGYHTYTEVGAAAKAVADAHPTIAKRFSLGKSYQGREI